MKVCGGFPANPIGLLRETFYSSMLIIGFLKEFEEMSISGFVLIKSQGGLGSCMGLLDHEQSNKINSNWNMTKYEK